MDETIEEKIRVVYPLVINLDKPSKTYTITVKRGDDKSRAIKFTLVRNGVKYNLSGNDVASLRAIREDGTITFADCPVQEDGTCEYTFTENMTSASGMITAELSVTTGVGETLTIFEFYIIVEKILYNENDYVSENDLSGFKEYLAKARAAAVAAEEAKGYCEYAVEITAEALKKAEQTLERTQEAIVKADEAVERAEEAARTIEGAEAEVLENMEIVRGFKDEAESARNSAEGYKDAAEASKDAAAISEENAKASEEYVADAIPVVLQAASDTLDARNIAIQKAQDAIDAKNIAVANATLAESFAHGQTESRPGEDEDNAAYYAELARQYAESASRGVLPATTTKIGGVIIGNSLDVDTSGKIDVKKDNELNPASTNPITNKAVSNALETKSNKYTSENRTLYANTWIGTEAPYTYDLGYDNTFDLEVMLSNSADSETIDAVSSYRITGNGTDNILRAWGDKPEIDIPIIVRKVVK